MYKITEKFKVHCSAISEIMADATGSRKISVGAKTAVEKFARNIIYQRKGLSATSKQTEKGIAVEWEAIKFMNNHFGTFWAKNEQLLEGDFSLGTPDIIESNELVVDAKCPYSHATFPCFDAPLPKNYWWQMQGYMHLTGAKKAKVIYCLINAPDEMIKNEAWKMSRSKGLDAPTPEIVAAVTKELTYDDIAPELRIKVYDVDYEPAAIEKLKLRVEACNEYLKSL